MSRLIALAMIAPFGPLALAAEAQAPAAGAVATEGRDHPQAMARDGDFRQPSNLGDGGFAADSADPLALRPQGAPRAVDRGGAARRYPLHTRIVSTTFWVGEIFNPKLPDGSQVCSTYDSLWAYHWSGIDDGRVPRNARACPGAIKGGCDGVAGQGGKRCDTEPRTAKNDYFPTSGPRPKENPFYLDLPYDDINDPVGFAHRCANIPWAGDRGYAGRCADKKFSYMKNRWVEITGPNGHVCYGQIEDAGPSHGALYHDARYVFGRADARPIQTHFNNAGMDVSPALNGCLGYAALDGDHDRIDWRFVDTAEVPRGPWMIVVTTSGVTE